MSRFFGRKSLRKLTEASTSNRNDDDIGQGYTEDHPPVFSFPEPIDPSVHPTLATNRETHLSHRVSQNTGKCEMKLRCTWSKVNKWWQAMEARGDCFASIRDEILASPFGSLFRCGHAVADRCLIYALIERWWDTTHTFHFPQGEIGITPLDVTMLTGMSVGSGRKVTCGEAQYNTFDYARMHWPSLASRHWHNGGIRSSFFFNEFIDGTIGADDGWYPTGDERETYVRSFYFYLITQCFFPTGDSSLRLGWIQCLEDLHSIHTYDWGGAMFGALIFALDQASRPANNVGEGQCGGFTPLLQFWWYEYVPAMAPLLRTDFDRDLVPRMRAWVNDCRIQQRSQVRRNLNLDRNQLECRSTLAINWTPWYGSNYLTVDADDAPDAWTGEAIVSARRSYHLSQCRVVFEYRGMVVWYLGDRCWHQIFGAPSIPHPPPENMRPLGEASPWRDFVRDHPSLWPHGSKYILEGGDYDSYWRLVSRGPILPSRMYRAGNMDFVGHEGTREDVRIPHPAAPYASSQGPYQDSAPPPFNLEDPWRYDIVTSHGLHVNVSIPPVDRSYLPTLAPDLDSLDEATLRERYADSLLREHSMRDTIMNSSQENYNYLSAERQRADEADRRRAEVEAEFGRMSLDRSRSRKSRRRQPGEGTSRS